MQLTYKVIRGMGLAHEIMSVGVLVSLPDGTIQSVVSEVLMGENTSKLEGLPKGKLVRTLIRSGYSLSHEKPTTQEAMQKIAQDNNTSLKLQYGIHR